MQPINPVEQYLIIDPFLDQLTALELIALRATCRTLRRVVSSHRLLAYQCLSMSFFHERITLPLQRLLRAVSPVFSRRITPAVLEAAALRTILQIQYKLCPSWNGPHFCLPYQRSKCREGSKPGDSYPSCVMRAAHDYLTLPLDPPWCFRPQLGRQWHWGREYNVTLEETQWDVELPLQNPASTQPLEQPLLVANSAYHIQDIFIDKLLPQTASLYVVMGGMPYYPLTCLEPVCLEQRELWRYRFTDSPINLSALEYHRVSIRLDTGGAELERPSCWLLIGTPLGDNVSELVHPPMSAADMHWKLHSTDYPIIFRGGMAMHRYSY